MADLRYFYKALQLGDIGVALATFAASGEPAIFGQSSYGDTAPVEDQGGNGIMSIDVPVIMQKGGLGDEPGETDQQYQQRRFQFAYNVLGVKQDRGPVVCVYDRHADITAPDGDYDPNLGVEITLVDPLPNASSGDHFYLSNGDEWQIGVMAYNAGTPSITVDLEIGLNVGSTVAYLQWYAPNYYLMSEVSVGGDGDGRGWHITEELALQFQGFDPLVWNA